MSFFVSNSLKNIITEDDLSASSPIKIIEQKQTILIYFCNDVVGEFALHLNELSLSNTCDEFEITTDYHNLSNILKCHNQKINYSILLNGEQFMQNKGLFVLSMLQTNKDDNCVLCKIDIDKRR